MLELALEGVPPDCGALLPKIGQEECARLSEYMEAAVTSANLSYFENIVHEAAQKRRLQKFYLDAIRRMEEAPLDELLSANRIETRKVLLAGNGGGVISAREIASELWDFIERRFEEKGALSGIPSGLKDLDRLTDGWQRGDLIIVAGRPGTGKSALAMHFAQTSAAAGWPVGFISLEMERHQLGIRSLSSLSEVELWRLRKGFLSSDQLTNIASAVDKFAKLPISYYFAARDTRSISKIITLMVEVQGCRLILVDYLQLARAEGGRERREREVAEISWALKTAAQTHGVPIIALSQLNRDVEREGRRPILADLRESGAIEQDADVVLFLFRAKAWEDNAGKGPIEIIIAKGRNIGTGSITVFFDAERMRFGDLQEEKQK
jgi:replicative DNA helicase